MFGSHDTQAVDAYLNAPNLTVEVIAHFEWPDAAPVFKLVMQKSIDQTSLQILGAVRGSGLPRARRLHGLTQVQL